MKTLKLNQKVFWTDPEGINSGRGKVTYIQYKPIDNDTVIALKMEDEGEVECFIHELKEVQK
jgi:hypothetical protein